MKNEVSFSSRSSRPHWRALLRLARKPLVPLTFVLLSLPLMWALIQWLRDEDVNAPRIQNALRPSLEAIGAQSIIVRENGRKVWEFSADRITISPDKRFATATNMRRGVLFRQDKPFLTVSAATVRLNQETLNWQATGKIEASGPDGFSIVTNRANWSQKRERLSCPNAVKAKLRGLQIDSRNVFYEAKTGQLKCPEVVEVRSPQVTIREGRDVVVDTRSRRVEFRSGVHVTIKRAAVEAFLKNKANSAPNSASASGNDADPTAAPFSLPGAP